MSGEEFRTMIGGSSSSCYSTTSSNSSSVENISTSSSIENGDQLTITFVPRKAPSSRCLSPFLEDVFSIDDICFGDRVSPVQKSFRGSPSWYSDINSAVSPLKTVTNDDESGSSSSSGYSQAIQHLSGDGILLKSLEKGGSVTYELMGERDLLLINDCFFNPSIVFRKAFTTSFTEVIIRVRPKVDIAAGICAWYVACSGLLLFSNCFCLVVTLRCLVNVFSFNGPRPNRTYIDVILMKRPPPPHDLHVTWRSPFVLVLGSGGPRHENT
ncbi:hypothetical protein Ocin01_00470 [Orchesella cincta]|uniref:Uncharacterized protein n=1 Tax=Orchesella cincta TaxID=48709 RepID=A0A1D2NMA8_ORCCI|nr:hypothetical protein Ocin01_00470 [Orchesella cincta]